MSQKLRRKQRFKNRRIIYALLYRFSECFIRMKTASGGKINNGGNRIVPYVAYNIRMNSIVILGFMLSLFSLVATETFFPGKLIVLFVMLNYVFFNQI